MFWERFYNLCEKNGEKPLRVAKKLNIANGSITKWKNGAIPSVSNLILIADYFEVSTDYLLRCSEKKMTRMEQIRTVTEDELVESIYQRSAHEEHTFMCYCRELPECDPDRDDCCPEDRHKSCIRAWLNEEV